jgi:hypothetical protein
MDFRPYLYRLKSGEMIIGRNNPQGDVMNPFFIIVEWVKDEQKPEEQAKKRITIRPFLEMFEGLTKIEDNYFIVIKKDDVSIKLEAADNLVMLYQKVSKEISEIKTEKAEKSEEKESKDNVVPFKATEKKDG